MLFLVSKDRVFGVLAARGCLREFVLKREILAIQDGSDLSRLNAVMIGNSAGEFS
jgi:hypothetical protein